jgi:hypothetical protein
MLPPNHWVLRRFQAPTRINLYRIMNKITVPQTLAKQVRSGDKMYEVNPLQ